MNVLFNNNGRKIALLFAKILRYPIFLRAFRFLANREVGPSAKSILDQFILDQFILNPIYLAQTLLMTDQTNLMETREIYKDFS